MTVPAKIYDFLIEPIRDADQREGRQLLERYLLGPQDVWETTDQTIKDIPKLWSITECPDKYLKYLKWIVGWTSQLDHITDQLTDDELRRLISISGRLWKERGSDDTIVDVMRFATGARNRYWNWFDFRWVLPYQGPPDAVSWIPDNLLFDVTSLVGSTNDAVGIPVRVTSKITGQFEDGQVVWFAGTLNAVFIFGYLGQGSPPSTNADDYEVRLVSPRGTELGEEHEGRDPWIVGLPSPTDSAASTESNLRIVDDGTLNKTLVINLLKLMRATNERWEITYLLFLDQFIDDGDDTQWIKNTTDCPSLAVANGKMTLTDTSQVEFTQVNAAAASWSNYMAYFRIRGTSTFGTQCHGFYFYLTSTTTTYIVFCVPNLKTVYLWRLVGGTPTALATADLSLEAYYDDVWYGYRVTTATEGSSLRIKIFLDGNEIIDYLDASPIASGTVGVFHHASEVIEVDEVEVLDLPAESDYLDINP